MPISNVLLPSDDPNMAGVKGSKIGAAGGKGGAGTLYREPPRVEAGGAAPTPWAPSIQEAAIMSAERERARAEALDAENAAKQNEMLDMLMARARGEGPSSVQDALQLGHDRASRGALSMARSGRGNPALAMRQAQMQQGQLASELGLQSGIMAAKEQLAAGSELNNAIQAARSGDLSKAAGIWKNVNADKMLEMESRKIALQRQMYADQLKMQKQNAWMKSLSSLAGAAILAPVNPFAAATLGAQGLGHGSPRPSQWGGVGGSASSGISPGSATPISPI